MTNEIYTAALRAGLSPLLARIATILAEVEGPERARSYITEVLAEEALKAARRPDDSAQVRETIVSFSSDIATALEQPAPSAASVASA